jgi:hypothetical protein
MTINWRKMAFMVWIVLAFFLTNCSSPSSSNTPPKNTPSLSGTWKGTFRNGETGNITFTLNQSGNKITGTFNTSTNRFGDMNGTVSGSSVSGTLTYNDSCGGSSSVKGTISDNGRKIEGDGNTSDCLGNYSFTFTVNKQ